MSTSKIKAGIIGGAGYTGGETLRLLLNHPHVDVVFVQSRSQAGKPVTTTHHDLVGETDLIYSADFNQAVDVLFLCLSHGESKKLLSEQNFPASTRIIDLG
jgi:N-acetyl-gamma-glutamyl-phosphate reductase